MTLTKTTDHEEEGIALLIAQFRDKANIEVLVRALMAQVQDVEDALWGLYTTRSIESGEGVTLDVIGRIVGQERGDDADAEYRVWLKARVLVNRSKGKPEQLIRIVKVVVGDDIPVIAEDLDGAFIIRTDEAISDLAGARIGEMLEAAGALGVHPSFLFFRSGDIFTYSDDGTLIGAQPEGYNRGEYAGVSSGQPAPFPGQLDFYNPNNSAWLGYP